MFTSVSPFRSCTVKVPKYTANRKTKSDQVTNYYLCTQREVQGTWYSTRSPEGSILPHSTHWTNSAPNSPGSSSILGASLSDTALWLVDTRVWKAQHNPPKGVHTGTWKESLPISSVSFLPQTKMATVYCKKVKLAKSGHNYDSSAQKSG